MSASGIRPVIAVGALSRAGNLAASLAEVLEREIREGRLGPGDRLPTEAVLSASAGVSRTVVREAVAALRASGLVETRQGAGAFVRLAPPLLPRFGSLAPGAVEELLAFLELRLAVEAEAAALAAARRGPADIARLDATLDDLARARIAGGDGAEADLGFHLALASATGNAWFVEFLERAGPAAVPRRRLAGAGRADAGEAYVALVEREHRAIRDAVAAGQAVAAAAAMRLHLAGSRARYRQLLAAAGA